MLTVRELQPADIAAIADYWQNASETYLQSLGADKAKLPERNQLEAMLQNQLNQPYQAKQAYCTIWEINGKAIGHCNVNQIRFGKEAFMHLHVWQPDHRQKGFGVELVKLSLPYFFRNLQLQKLICEPYALNPAPNKTLQKAGFRFIKEYITIPGPINFEQPVKRWELTLAEFEKLI